MQPSTSAALAALALYAGHAFAGCATSNINLSHRVYRADCDSRDGPGTWTCQTNGAKLALAGTEITINAGYQQSIVQASCRSQPHIASRISCTPGAWGMFFVNCPHGDQIVMGEFVL